MCILNYGTNRRPTKLRVVNSGTVRSHRLVVWPLRFVCSDATTDPIKRTAGHVLTHSIACATDEKRKSHNFFFSFF